MSTWYLGPRGALRALNCPDGAVEIEDVRYGGIHQGLSGARTLDVTGYKSEVTLNYTFLTQSEYSWLEALWLGQVRGPYALINPLKKNRLSVDATRLVPSTAPRSSVLIAATEYGTLSASTSLVPINDRTLWVSEWDPAGTPLVRFDTRHRTPVLPLETITCSVYAGLSGGAVGTVNGALELKYFNVNGTQVSTTQSETAELSSTWERFSITRTVPSGTASVEFAFRGGASTPQETHFVMAPQIESGASATDWEPGGGAPKMLIESMPSPSPRFPMRNATVKLVEA